MQGGQTLGPKQPGILGLGSWRRIQSRSWNLTIPFQPLLIPLISLSKLNKYREADLFKAFLEITGCIN